MLLGVLEELKLTACGPFPGGEAAHAAVHLTLAPAPCFTLLEALLAGLKDGGCSVLMSQVLLLQAGSFPWERKSWVGNQPVSKQVLAPLQDRQQCLSRAAESFVFQGLSVPGAPFSPNPDGAASPTQHCPPAPLTLPCLGCTGLAEPSCTPAPPKPQGKTQTNPGMTQESPSPAALHAPVPRGSTNLCRSIPILIKNLFPSPPTAL